MAQSGGIWFGFYLVCSAYAASAERIGPHFVDLLVRLHIAYIARPCNIDVLLDAVAAAARRLRPDEATAQGNQSLSCA